MLREWNDFLKLLPPAMKVFLKEKVGNKSDFELKEQTCSEWVEMVYCSKTAKIEVCFILDLYGSFVSIWYPDIQKNNDNGDPTYTEHALSVDSPYDQFLQMNREMIV